MGIVDYLSRHPTEKAASVSHYDEQFVLAIINKCRHDLQLPPISNAKAHAQPQTTSQSDADTAYLIKHAPRICFSHRSTHGRSINEIQWTDCSPSLQTKLLDSLFTQLPTFDFHTPLLKVNMRPSATSSPSRPSRSSQRIPKLSQFLPQTKLLSSPRTTHRLNRNP